jgi:hypothetical protein
LREGRREVRAVVLSAGGKVEVEMEGFAIVRTYSG